jgi:outer membrane protein assembly factor BamD (BamD/ComL family)
MRFASAEDEGEELLIRVQERLPGSRLAERAGIELADHYYRERELSLAGEAYELFLANYPNSPYRNKAMQRRIYSNIGRFKGPRYDGSALIDASVLIRRYMSLYPSQANAAGLDQALLNRIDESAAQQLFEIANWYIFRDDLVAGRATLQRLVRLHPQSAAAGRAILELESRGWPLKHEPAMLVAPVDENAATNPSEDDTPGAKKPATATPAGAKK